MTTNHQNAVLGLTEAAKHVREADHKVCSGLYILALGYQRAAELELERSTLATVAAARAHGATWTDIGSAIGISKQAAAKRFGFLDAIARGDRLQPYA